MVEQRRAVIKLGGGLITEKSGLCEPDHDSIRISTGAIASLVEEGWIIALVHGAGSFGHAKAKRWRLTEGPVDADLGEEDGITNQLEAVKAVRQDMMNLNRLVTNALSEHGIDSVTYHPHKWARGTGENFTGNLDFLGKNKVTITYGDVVDVGDDGFGILSGDDIMLRIAKEWKDVESCIFCLADCDGILTHPPGHTDSTLLNTWDPSVGFGGRHESEIDVTGGIDYKAHRAASIAQTVPLVWFVDGRFPTRIVDACNGSNTIGTRIFYSPVRL